MNDGFGSELDASEFAGTARLFPLPEVTLFPHVAQPLHIFEPRYRAMLEAAMDSDRLIAMAILRSGWEGAEEPLPLERSVCLGRIVSHTPLPDGRSNIILLGLRRGRIRREMPQRDLFREAEIDLCEDLYPPQNAKTRAIVQQSLLARLRRLLHSSPTTSQQQLDQLAQANATLGLLTDVVASVAPIGADMKLQLLQENNVDLRAAQLLDALEPPHRTPYDWNFSDN